MSKIAAGKGDTKYNIYISNKISKKTLNHYLKTYNKLLVVTDSGIPKEHLKNLKSNINNKNLYFFTLPMGENSKSFASYQKIINELVKFNFDRTDALIAFGGGVVGDIAGFAASILLRGIDFIQVPTTLLAQVDSSVGGKTGINSSKSKNLIGSFHQPIAVIADLDILKTLPKREFLAGLVEVIKYGLIYDVDFFNTIENNLKYILNHDHLKLNQVVSKSCEIKSLIIKNDAKENGKRALLNLGHTFGHAIESFGNYDGTIIHGEAVSIGICLAFKLSSKMGYCPQNETDRVVSFFKKLTLPTSLHEVQNLSITTTEMLNKFKYDKKNKNNQLTFILNEKIGKSFIKNNMDEDILTKFLNDEI